MASRSQRYRLTHEFVLRSRSDYARARQDLSDAIGAVWERWVGAAPDYLAIEKIEDGPLPSSSSSGRLGNRSTK